MARGRNTTWRQRRRQQGRAIGMHATYQFASLTHKYNNHSNRTALRAAPWQSSVASGGEQRSLASGGAANNSHGGHEKGGYQAASAGQPAGAGGGACGAAPREGQQPAPPAGSPETWMCRGARWRAQALPCRRRHRCRHRCRPSAAARCSSTTPHCPLLARPLSAGHAGAAPPAHLLHRQL